MNKTPRQSTSLVARLIALPRDKTDALLLIFSCTLVLLPFAQHSPLWLNAIVGTLIAWRSWITLRGQKMPAKWLLSIITFILLAGVYVHFRTLFGKDAGMSYLIVLACLKMLEMHMRRDAVVVIFTCYFLLLGQLLYSQSLLTAIYILLCICMLVSTQISFRYYQLTPSLFKRIFQGFNIVGMALPLAFILFLLFPRFQGALWGNQQNIQTGMTGLSDTMEPGNVAALAESDQIAFRVKFKDITPEASKLYWRAVVLDIFNGRSWTASTPTTQHESTSSAQGVLVTQEIIMEPHQQRWLFGLDRPKRIETFSTTNSSTASNDLESGLTTYWEMRSRTPIQDRIRYTITSNLSNTSTIQTSSPSLTEQRSEENKALQLPDGFNPLTLRWAAELRQQTNDPKRLTNLVINYFREHPFHYTLSPPPLGKNQVDDFMFRTQSGFCEHYASAFVIIMRALHVPARVVTGYQGGEMNAVDGLMTIRQSDAHAWAEVWLPPHGWVRYDPTAAVAPNRIEHGLHSSLPARRFSGFLSLSQQTWLSDLVKEIRLHWDATNSAWNLWALNFNLNKQKELLSNLFGIKNPQAVQVGITMMVAVTLVIAALSFLLLDKKPVQHPVDTLYDLFCNYMSKQGYARLSYEGAHDYCLRLQRGFHHTDVVRQFLMLYAQYKYGKQDNANQDTQQLRQLKTLLKLCLQQKPFSS